jgi:hypothetical protein
MQIDFLTFFALFNVKRFQTPISQRSQERKLLFDGHAERFLRNTFDNRVATEALGANAHRFRAAVRGRNANVLKVRFESAGGDAGNFRTNPLEAFRATAGGDVITDDFTFTANFTNSRHCYSSLIS